MRETEIKEEKEREKNKERKECERNCVREKTKPKSVREIEKYPTGSVCGFPPLPVGASASLPCDALQAERWSERCTNEKSS